MKEKGNLFFCEDEDDCNSIKDMLLKRNQSWIAEKRDWIDYNDSLDTIIVACMDSRVAVEKIFDLNPGEALVIRNAGNIVTEDVIRSVLAGLFEIHVKYVIIMGHTRCGMAMKSNEKVMDELIEHIPEDFKKLYNLQSKEEIIKWFGFFDDGKWNENAKENAELLRKTLLKFLDEDKMPEIVVASYDLDSGKVTFL